MTTAFEQEKREPLSSENYHTTACVLCSINCGLKVKVEDNQIVDVKADVDSPISEGHICNKAFSINTYNHHKQRLTSPLKKQADGSFREITWQQAYAEIGEKLSGLYEQHGGDSIAVCGLGGQANHQDTIMGLAWLKSYDSSWFFSAYAQEKTQHALVEELMYNAPKTGVMHPDPWNADFLLMIGTNPIHSNRGYKTAESLRAFCKDPKTKLAMIDPRVSETARRADKHIALKSGTDLWLYTAMLAHIAQQGLEDKEFVSKHVRDYQGFKQRFAEFNIEELAQVCEVPVDDIKQLAEDFAKADKASVFADTGVEWIEHTTLVNWLLRILTTVTGNFCQPGGNYFRPSFTPDTKFVEAKNKFVAPVSKIPGISALSPFEMFSPNILPEEILRGPIKAVVTSNSNPLRSYAGSAEFKEAFEKLDLLVVIELAMTESARVADYILPAPSGYEKWDWASFGRHFPELTLQLKKPILTTASSVENESEIFHQLRNKKTIPDAPSWLKNWASKKGENAPFASGLGLAIILSGFAGGMLFGKGKPTRVFSRWYNWAYQIVGPQLPAKQIATLWMSCHLFAVTRFRELEWPKTKNPFALARDWFKQILENRSGSVLAKLPVETAVNAALRHKDKKAHLLPPLFNNALDKALIYNAEYSGDYPLWLTAGERSPWTANTIHRDNGWRKGKGAECRLKINPETAAEHSIAADDNVALTTPWGQAEFAVTLDKGMRKDNLSMPNGMGLIYPNEEGELVQYGVNANDLTSTQYRDPFTGIPFHKMVPCKIEKMEKVA